MRTVTKDNPQGTTKPDQMAIGMNECGIWQNQNFRFSFKVQNKRAQRSGSKFLIGVE